MLQIVSKPTRCTNSSATLIDHVITNSVSDLYDTIILISQLSDHFPVLHFLSCSRQRSSPKLIASRDFSDANLSKFKTSLSAMGWNDVTSLSDPQLAFNNFSENFTTLYDLHFPLTSKNSIKIFIKSSRGSLVGYLLPDGKKLNSKNYYLPIPPLHPQSLLKFFATPTTKS